MTRRWMAGAVLGLAACGGRMQMDAHPAGTAAAPPAVALEPPPSSAAGSPVPATASPRGDTAVSYEIKLTHDSVADAAALDSLAKVKPSASLPDLPIDAHATWDLNVADFSSQPRVKYYLDYFTGRAHDRFQIWLQRMGRYEAYARGQFTARKLPGDFVYLALIESGFSPEAVSRTYAVGMWQFMFGTGKSYGLRVDGWLDERRDPIKSTDAAAHHLEDLTLRFGSHYLAAAAYNAGAGRVERGLGHMNLSAPSVDDSAESGRDGAFFSLADTRLIRDETKNYVPQLIAAAIVAKEPAKYGFVIDTGVAPFSHDSVMVDGGTGLDLIARLADTTMEALRDLNPHLLRLITPPGERYPVRVPTGSAGKIAAAYAGMSTEERRAVLVHYVAAGETVLSLARHYSVSADLIRAANRSARGRSLPPGTMLYVPVTTTISAALLREPDPPRTVRSVLKTYVVRAGESVASVAKRAGIPVTQLQSDNNLAAGTKVRPGQRLSVHRMVIVPVGAGSARSAAHPAASVAARTHVVLPGETVVAIAGHYRVTQSALIAINGLGKGARLRAGQTLKIPQG